MTDNTDPTPRAQIKPGHQPVPPGESSDAMNAGDKLVPVSEAIRYRKRAQTAEQQLEQLNEQLRDVSARLEEADQTITGLERRSQVDALLMEADAIDVETARLLAEQAVHEMDEPDVSLAIEDLRRHKPYLFRRRIDKDASAMAPAVQDHGHDPAELAAQDAARSGDRRDLLRYLRLRRSR